MSGIYIAAQILSDIASLRIIDFAGYAVDAGTLIYPITFTVRDLIHKVAGKTAARTMIFLAALTNLFMAGFFLVVARWPADVVTGAQPEFGRVLAPVWGIVIASIVAEVISELIDTETYQLWANRFGERLQWGRVLASNGVAIPFDSAIFVGLATAFGVFPAEVAWTIFGVNVVIKGVVAVASIPLIYVVKPTPLSVST